MNQTYEVHGMHCASCASIIKKTLEKHPEIDAVEINSVTEKAKVSSKNQVSIAKLNGLIQPYGYSLSKKSDEALESAGVAVSSLSKLKLGLAVGSSLIAFGFMAVELLGLPESWMSYQDLMMWFQLILATIVLVVLGQPYLKAIPQFVKTGKANMNTLIGIGTGTAYVYSLLGLLFSKQFMELGLSKSLYFEVTIVVISFVTIGAWMETFSKKRTTQALESLAKLQVRQATKRTKDGLEVVPVEEVVAGDVLVVRPGDQVPLDGVIVSGRAHLDESMITGESLPVSKTVGQAVVGGTLVTDSALEISVTATGSDTVLSRILKMVEEAQLTKAPIEHLVDRIASVFVPVVLVLSVVVMLLWLGLGLLGVTTAGPGLALTAFVGMLVIACPCALGLATPTAMVVSIGRAAASGILIKDAGAIQSLASARIVMLDKTGTITEAKPVVKSIQTHLDISESKVLAFAAGLEANSEHPLALAVRKAALEASAEPVKIEEFQVLGGRGVVGRHGKTQLALGNATLLSELGVEIPDTKHSHHTALYLSRNQQVVATLLVADTIRPNAKQVIKTIKQLGMTPVLLTGDRLESAAYVASQVGIEEVVSQVLPDQKADMVKKYQTHGQVIMVGDGINDAPALTQSEVGIAMGSGTQIAIEAASITLLGGDLSKLTESIRIAKTTMRVVKQNLFWAFVYNLISLPIAAGILYPVLGWMLNPAIAGAAMAFSSVSVVTNSLRLRRAS